MSWVWSGARSGRNRPRSPVRLATAQRSGCTSALATAASARARLTVVPSSPAAASPAMRCSLREQRQPLMCLANWVIWLLTSTVRGSASMAAARVSGVQRSSLSTDSAIDQPP